MLTCFRGSAAYTRPELSWISLLQTVHSRHHQISVYNRNKPWSNAVFQQYTIYLSNSRGHWEQLFTMLLIMLPVGAWSSDRVLDSCCGSCGFDTHRGPTESNLSKLLTSCMLRPTQPTTLSGMMLCSWGVMEAMTLVWWQVKLCDYCFRICPQ